MSVRVLIVGSPGSGKSTLSKKIAKDLDLPLFHLDDLYWKKSWQRPTPEDWTHKLSSLLAQDKWVIDGNYYDSFSLRLARATHVVYLDCSVFLCLARVLKRAIIRRFCNRDSLPVEIKNDQTFAPKIQFRPKFIKMILFFKLIYKKKMFRAIRDQNVPCQIVGLSRLSSAEKIAEFFRNIE